jgi:hypothetical protein
MIKLPKILHGKTKKEVLDFLSNRIQYYAAMSNHYKHARQTVESGKEGRDYVFEDDKEFERKHENSI